MPALLHSTKKDISRSLQIQFSVFQNDMERYFDQLAVMGVNLSEDMSAEVDKELALRQMSFAQLNDSPGVLNALEEEMIEPLHSTPSARQDRLFRRFCCWMLPSQHPHGGAEHSRRAAIAQKSEGADFPTVPLLRERCTGGQGLARDAHRKWRMGSRPTSSRTTTAG